MIDLSKLKEDRDVVEPFIERLLLRLRERHPSVTLDNITVNIEVRLAPERDGVEGFRRIARVLSDMAKEGVVI